jgi:L-aspartate oxidase
MQTSDILIVGSGIAGLSFALHLAKERPDLSICILAKGDKAESNTRYAQGGIAVVLNKLTDSFQQHIDDTLKAGGGLCNKSVVEMVVKKAPERLKELIEWGVEFDKKESGQFSTGLEGGHSQARILHHQDTTGLEIEKKLLLYIRQFPNVKIFQHHFALDLLTDTNNSVCYGATVLNQKDHSIDIFTSRVTMLATGGSGQVYKTTTNPTVSTGDGVAMAYRAYVAIENMQFIQFHPTAFYQKGQSPSFLISEAVRGFGATLVNKKGQRFLFDYDTRGELATRDIVSEAIYTELKKSGEEHVFMDCRHLDLANFKTHFPNIYSYCLKVGIDISNDWIPVAPAAHYQCGGITVNKKAQTSIPNLYACGECSCSGLHGSNRLASNSLLEAVVFANEASLHVLQTIDTFEQPTNFEIESVREQTVDSKRINELKNEIQALMIQKAGIVKTQTNLQEARQRLTKIDNIILSEFKGNAPHTDLWELKNLLAVAKLIVSQSLQYITQKETLKKHNKHLYHSL